MEALLRSYKDYDVNETIAIVESHIKKVGWPHQASRQARCGHNRQWQKLEFSPGSSDFGHIVSRTDSSIYLFRIDLSNTFLAFAGDTLFLFCNKEKGTLCLMECLSFRIWSTESRKRARARLEGSSFLKRKMIL